MIYGLFDPVTQQCRYIGKTVRSLDVRLRRHVSAAKAGRRQHVSVWVRSLLLRGIMPEIFWIEQGCADWREAEVFWIEYFRFLGCNLTNISAGGEGVPMSPQIAAKISATRKLRGMGLPATALANTLATREKMWKVPEWRAARQAATSAAQKMLWADPAHREKMRKARSASFTAERSAALAAGKRAARQKRLV